MSNREKSLQQLKKLFATSPVRVIPATVLSIEDNTCTVQALGSDLILTGVKLFADKQDLSTVAISPVIGSLILLGTIGSKLDFADLCICQVNEADAISLPVGDYAVELSQTGAVITGPKGRITLTPERLQTLFADPA